MGVTVKLFMDERMEMKMTYRGTNSNTPGKILVKKIAGKLCAYC